MPQYKAAHHVHTTNSDGANTLASVVEEHYTRGYDVLAITDHNFLTPDWSADNPRAGFTTMPVSPARFAEIASGADRGGRPMLMIPYTSELSWPYHDDICSFMTDIDPPGPAIHDSLDQVQAKNGLAHVNHPGRYTGGQSSNQWYINQYVDIFMAYDRCVGMEIINKRDNESWNDRFLWDNINAITIPQGRFVWGFSNEDTHSNNDTGYSFNIMIMPELTVAAFEAAMLSGSFYAVARVAWSEGVNNQDRNAQTPIIHSVTGTERAITITAEHYSRIDWIATGSAKVAEGETFRLPVADIGNFVRANVIGPGGIAFTRPWHIHREWRAVRRA